MLFKKKKKTKNVEVATENADIVISTSGNIKGAVCVNTGFGCIEMPINTNIQQIEEKERRENDPNSCERLPNESEVVVPISRDMSDSLVVRAFGWSKYEEYSRLEFRSRLQRYNNFIMSKSDYGEMLEYIHTKESANKLHWQLRDKYNEGLACEKSGNFTDAEKCYNECLVLDQTFFDSFNRLIIMYHRNKEYEKEISVLQRAVVAYPNIDKWQTRLNKLIEKV